MAKKKPAKQKRSPQNLEDLFEKNKTPTSSSESGARVDASVDQTKELSPREKEQLEKNRREKLAQARQRLQEIKKQLQQAWQKIKNDRREKDKIRSPRDEDREEEPVVRGLDVQLQQEAKKEEKEKEKSPLPDPGAKKKSHLPPTAQRSGQPERRKKR